MADFFGKYSGVLGGGGGSGGSGDVVGPGSATDNAVARFDGTTGKLIQNSTVIVDDSGNTTGVGTFNASGTATVGNLIDSGLTASQLVVTDGSKQLASVARGDLTDAGTDGIVITGGSAAVVGAGTSIAQHVADATHNGYLSSTDWSTFNSKQAALTIGNLTDAGTDGIVVTGGTGAVIGSGTSIAQQVADATHNGYLSSTDWSTFNSKQATISIGAFSGTPTAAGLTLTGAAINLDPADGTHPGGVSTGAQTFAGPKTFSSTIVGSISGNAATVTTNANLTGPITSSGNATSIASQTGTGTKFVVDTSPTIVTPTIAKLANLTTNGIVYTTSSDGTLNSGPLSGDITTSGAVSTLATVNSNVGSFTNSSITVNAKGLVTAASSGSAVANTVVSSTLTYGSWPITAGQYGDLTSISLSAGTWCIDAYSYASNSGAITTGELQMGVTTTSGNSSTGLTASSLNYWDATPPIQANNATNMMIVAGYIVQPGSTTTYYLKGFASVSNTNLNASARITAVKLI